MYSALYYPHTDVQSEALLKTALLMWDELHVIVPENGFRPGHASKEGQKALEVIGRPRVPTPAEKEAAHDLIEDFATRPLPVAFSYADRSGDRYELYPQKLMDKTWNLLQDAKLVGQPLANQDYPTAQRTGLSIMSILADCCAGTQLARVTDQGAAYAFLSDAVVGSDQDEATDAARQRLASVPLRVVAVDDIPLEKLVAMRQREAAGKALGLAALRHRLVDNIEKQVPALAAAKTESDHDELERRFEQFLRDDLRELREALKLETTATLTSNVIVASVLAVAAAFSWVALPHLGLSAAGLIAASGAVTTGPALTSIGGLINTKVKFAKTRMKILESHPTAYLYEALGGRGRL